MTLRQIAFRLSVSKSAVQEVTAPYRTKVLEKEGLFTRSDLMMMTGLKPKAVLHRARKLKIGRRVCKQQLYTHEDIEKIDRFQCERSVRAAQVRRLTGLTKQQMYLWTQQLGISSIYTFSPAEVEQLMSAVNWFKGRASCKRLARRLGCHHKTLARLARLHDIGCRAPVGGESRTRYFTDEEGQRMAALLTRRRAT